VPELNRVVDSPKRFDGSYRQGDLTGRHFGIPWIDAYEPRVSRLNQSLPLVSNRRHGDTGAHLDDGEKVRPHSCKKRLKALRLLMLSGRQVAEVTKKKDVGPSQTATIGAFWK
jgi:hypothetical protein